MEWKILAFEKSLFLEHFAFSPSFRKGFFDRKEIFIFHSHTSRTMNSHISTCAYGSHGNTMGRFGHSKCFSAKNWNHFTMGIVMVVMIHLPFLSLFHQNEYTFKHKRWFALAASAAATGRAYCAGYEVVDESRMNPIWGCGTVLSRMEPLEAESISQRRRSRCHELSRFGYSDYRWIIGENGCLLQDLNQDELV